MLRRLAVAACLLALAGALPAADAGAAQVRAFQQAMAGQDQVAKKRAIAALASRSVGNDDEILPLLIGAVGDRQASEAAIAALRTRTGLTPAAGRGEGGYPGYPNGDSTAAWNAWLTARKAERDKQEELKKAKEAAEEAKKKAEEAAKPKEGEGKEGEATADGAATPGEPTGTPAEGAPVAKPEAPKAPPGRDPEFGGLDRITFRTGGSLLCYVLSKRIDSEGNLVSVRIVHPDQGGEETLAAELIARIEDDIR